MQALFDRLPGEVVALKDVQSTLKEMWNMNQEVGPCLSQRPDFRAMQMNLILQLGSTLRAEEGLASFSQAIDFSCAHPCRILVLCPCEPSETHLLLQAKLFSQCYIGRGTKNMSCCDAIILNYSETENNFLEDQVSIWLDNDLPTHHWVRGVAASRLQKEYFNCLSICNTILYDSALEEEAYKTIQWPPGVSVQDFCYLRTLQARQALGFHLGAYPPSLIIKDLKAVHCSFPPSFKQEAAYCVDWIKDALHACFELSKAQETLSYTAQAKPEGDIFSLAFEYKSSVYFRFSYDIKSGSGQIEAQLDENSKYHPLEIYTLSSEQILSQAIFD